MSDKSELHEPVNTLFQVSPKLLSLNLNSLVLTGIVLALFWPKRALSAYLASQQTPALFPGVFIAALLILSYTDLIHGAGELIEEPKYPFLLGRRVIPFEVKYHFFPKGFLQCALDSLFSGVLLLPLLLLAVAISQISGTVCLKALTILYVTALFFRFVGLLSFLLFGPQNILGFLLSRLIFALFMFVTGFLAPPMNPIVHILLLYQEKYVIFWLPVDSSTGYILSMTAAIMLLTFMNHVLVEHIQHTKKHEAHSA